MKLFRSILCIPVYNSKIIKSKYYLRAAKFADSIMFDLEDSLPLSKKSLGREILIKAVPEFYVCATRSDNFFSKTEYV